MKTLDRYIIRQFLINFAILFAVLMLLYVLVDLIINLDEFLQAGRLWSATGYGHSAALATLAAIGGYYGPMIILVYVFFSGLLVVGAMGFTLSALQRTRELTAMVASGLSMYRIAGPILVAGIALNALSIPIQEFVIPRLAPQLSRSQSQVKSGVRRSFPVRLAPDEYGNLLDAAQFNAHRGELLGLTILERNKRGLTTRQITAPQARWNEQRQGWTLSDGRAVAPAQDIPGVATPVKFYRTDLSPTVLLARRASIYPRLLSLSQLQRMERNPAVGEPERQTISRIIWSRFSLLAMNVLILVMGLAFFLHLGQHSTLVQAMKAAGVCMGAWGGGLLLLQVSVGWINPVAAAWLPVVLYLPISAALLQLVRS